MEEKKGSTNTSNVKENIKYLISSPEELEKISSQIFTTADVNQTGYFTFDDMVTIFNVSPSWPKELVQKLEYKPPTKSEVISILKLVHNSSDKKVTVEEFPLYLKILLQVLLQIVN